MPPTEGEIDQHIRMLRFGDQADIECKAIQLTIKEIAIILWISTYKVKMTLRKIEL